MALLMYVKGGSQGDTVRMDGEQVILGRSEDCHVVLRGQAVSREHAIIRKIQGKYYIEDMKSRNGTEVNNKPVSARTLLKENDRIKICEFTLSYHENDSRPVLPPHLQAKDETEADDQEEDSSTVEATLKESSKQTLEAQPAERLAMLLEIGAELTQTFDLEPLLPKIVDNMFRVFRQADRAFVILKEEGRLIPKVVKTRHAGDDGARFSKKIVNRCLETGQSLLSEDASNDKQFDMSQSIADCRIRSVMCVPLVSRSDGRAFGVIQLDTQNRFNKFTQDDLKLLLSVASLAAIALENARMHETLVARAGLERDLKLAQDVQKSFLPKKLPQPTGYELFAFYKSAQEVGGDYYDFIPLPGGRIAIMVGDVAGKGVPAALLMAKVAADARFCTLTEPDFATAVLKLNEHMQEAGQLDRFVTLLAVEVDPVAHRVTFVNAGHMPPLIYRHASASIVEGCTREQTGYPLGIVEGIPYEATSITLEPGDTVCLYTDGVTDAKNKDDCDFNMNGVHAALKDGIMRPRVMSERLIASVLQHSHGCKQHDDITVVSFGRLA